MSIYLLVSILFELKHIRSFLNMINITNHTFLFVIAKLYPFTSNLIIINIRNILGKLIFNFNFLNLAHLLLQRNLIHDDFFVFFKGFVLMSLILHIIKKQVIYLAINKPFTLGLFFYST